MFDDYKYYAFVIFTTAITMVIQCHIAGIYYKSFNFTNFVILNVSANIT